MIGSRGQWGKSLLYEDSPGIPLIMTGMDIPENQVCRTPVSLVDLYPTILGSVACSSVSQKSTSLPGQSLYDIMDGDYDSERIVFSEYHAYGAPSAAFILRKGSFKYIHYVGYEPELFDLEIDPQELTNLAFEEGYRDIIKEFEGHLRDLIDPGEVDLQARRAQALLVEKFGGIDKALQSGTQAETPAPKI